MRWPPDNQAALIAFYGNPGDRGPDGVAAQLVTVHPPFQMYYDGHPLKGISFHRRAAPALMSALNDIWDACDHDQAKLDKLGVSSTGGTYNPRKVRGSATKWSNHAFGAAIDLDPDHNGFNTGHGTMPQFVIDAFKAQGFRWGGDYKNRTDPMHFEACDGGEIASRPQAFVDMPMADGHPDNDPLDVDTSDPAPTEPSPATVVTARTVAGTGAGLVVAGQAINSAVGGAGDAVDKISVVATKTGDIIEQTRTVVSVPKPGFWYGVLHFVTSPEFVVSAVVLAAAAWLLVWFIQRQHKAQ